MRIKGFVYKVQFKNGNILLHYVNILYRLIVKLSVVELSVENCYMNQIYNISKSIINICNVKSTFIHKTL